jgi:type I restriction enzyme, S subunit
MAKGGKTTVVPRLRFPGFRKAGGWKVGALDEIAEFVNDKIPTADVTTTSYISTENLLPDFGDMIAASRLPSTESVTRYQVGDILISNIRPYLKKFWHADRNGGASNDVVVVRANGTVSKMYLAQFLKNDSFIAYVMRSAKGVKMPRGDVDAMRQYQVAFPREDEQQKIADCLTSLDEVIATQGQKVEALKTCKHGLMQQLFPKVGKTIPCLRFREFEKDRVWTEEQLIRLSTEPLSNGVFNDPKKVGAGYKLINVSDMYIDTVINESRLSLLELSCSDFESNRAMHGDIFFTRSSLVKSGIAVSNIYLGSSDDVTFDGHLIRFRPNTSKIIPLFAHYLFKTAPVRAQLIARGKSATMTTIGQADVASTMVLYPGKQEQQRIADCLSSIDACIVAESEKLESMKTHKQGLMQQLFPSPAES